MEDESKGNASRRSRSALLFMRMRDIRGHARSCACDRCRAARDRRYGFPHRYGERTTLTTRRVDRVDPNRELY